VNRKHTRLTYHRTWETGLGVAIRVTIFSPDFFPLPYFLFGLIIIFRQNRFPSKPVPSLTGLVLGLYFDPPAVLGYSMAPPLV
jgi:hypothetical protein